VQKFATKRIDVLKIEKEEIENRIEENRMKG
jgi:hypothetical protein